MLLQLFVFRNAAVCCGGEVTWCKKYRSSVSQPHFRHSAESFSTDRAIRGYHRHIQMLSNPRVGEALLRQVKTRDGLFYPWPFVERANNNDIIGLIDFFEVNSTITAPARKKYKTEAFVGMIVDELTEPRNIDGRAAHFAF